MNSGTKINGKNLETMVADAVFINADATITAETEFTGKLLCDGHIEKCLFALSLLYCIPFFFGILQEMSPIMQI